MALIALAVLVLAVIAIVALGRGKSSAGLLRVKVPGPPGLAPLGSGVAAALFNAGSVARIEGDGHVAYRVPVGTHPTNPAIEGAHLWVPVPGDQRLVELDASSGKVVRRLPGMYAAAVAGPPGALFLPTWSSPPKRASLWRGNAVTRLDTATGKTVWRKSFPGIVLTIAYYGGRVWVPNFAGNEIAVLDAKSGATVTTLKVPGRPVAVAAGRGCAWAAMAAGPLLRLDPVNGRIEGKTQVGGGSVDYMVAVQGGVWLAPYSTATTAAVERVSCQTGRVDVHLGAEGASQGLAVSGDRIWAADYGQNQVLRLKVPR